MLPSKMMPNKICGTAFTFTKRTTGTGWYFLDKIQAELQTLGGFGGVHRQRFGFHFYASNRFPHGIYYRIEDETVQIAAIIDSRRDPKLIRKILRQR